MDLPLPIHLVTSLLQLPKSPTEREDAANVRLPQEPSIYWKTPTKRPPFQLLVGTTSITGNLTNPSQLPPPREPGTSAHGLGHLLGGKERPSAPRRRQLCAHAGGRRGAAGASWAPRLQAHGGSGRLRGTAAPRLRRETGGGAGKTPGGLSGAAGATSEGGGAGLPPLPGEAAPPGPPGSCRTEASGLPQAPRAAPAASPAAAGPHGRAALPRAAAARPHATWPGGRRGA